MYAHYASLFKRITDQLHIKNNQQSASIKLNLNNTQFNQHLIELMHKNLINHEVLATIYEAEPTFNLEPYSWDQQDDALHEVPTFRNKLIYYPDYEVAITQPVLFYEESWNSDEVFYFAPNVEKMQLFIEAVNEQLRNVLMTQVSYMIDTEDGIRRSNIGDSELIKREDVFLEEHLRRNIFR